MIIAIGSHDKRGSSCNFIDGLFPFLYELIVTQLQSHSIEATKSLNNYKKNHEPKVVLREGLISKENSFP